MWRLTGGVRTKLCKLYKDRGVKTITRSLHYSEETRQNDQHKSEYTHPRTNMASFPSFQSVIDQSLLVTPTIKTPPSLPGDCNVKDYVLAHVTPYDGDSSFLASPTARTLTVWRRCEELIELERQRGILDVDTKTASTITSHKPGYVLSKEEEIIVGLQTDAPLKRACKPRGGFNVVHSALGSYGYQPDPDMAKTYTKVSNDCKRRNNQCDKNDIWRQKRRI